MKSFQLTGEADLMISIGSMMAYPLFSLPSDGRLVIINPEPEQTKADAWANLVINADCEKVMSMLL